MVVVIYTTRFLRYFLSFRLVFYRKEYRYLYRFKLICISDQILCGKIFSGQQFVVNHFLFWSACYITGKFILVHRGLYFTWKRILLPPPFRKQIVSPFETFYARKFHTFYGTVTYKSLFLPTLTYFFCWHMFPCKNSGSIFFPPSRHLWYGTGRREFNTQDL